MVNPDKTYLLWNGFDPDDFTLKAKGDSIIDKSAFNFTYTGNTGNLSDPARNPKIMIEAFIEFTKNVSNVRLNFIGNLPPDVVNYVSGLKEITISGMVKHTDIGQILKDSDVLLVILTKYEDLSAVPGKVYEYMAAGKYIIALTEEKSQLAYLISMYRFGCIVNPDSFEGIISKMLESKNIVKERVEVKPDYLFVKRFNRKNAAENLLNILQSVIDNSN
jgi:glycosyltransferase involved in cell wall biosynthesis